MISSAAASGIRSPLILSSKLCLKNAAPLIRVPPGLAFRKSRPRRNRSLSQPTPSVSYLAWQMNNDGWWGEGEIKFYLDGDTGPALSDGKVVAGSTGFPTICGTGTEDYFCGSYNFENKATKQYQEYTTPYAGVAHVRRPDGTYKANLRFSMYRWHVSDPIRFDSDLKVTMQALGWRSGGRYLPLQDDISSVAFWYQTLPTATFPMLPDRDSLEII